MPRKRRLARVLGLAAPTSNGDRRPEIGSLGALPLDLLSFPGAASPFPLPLAAYGFGPVFGQGRAETVTGRFLPGCIVLFLHRCAVPGDWPGSVSFSVVIPYQARLRSIPKVLGTPPPSALCKSPLGKAVSSRGAIATKRSPLSQLGIASLTLAMTRLDAGDWLLREFPPKRIHHHWPDELDTWPFARYNTNRQ